MTRFLFAFSLGAAGVAVLVALGFWQLERLAWKEDLLAEIETRIASEPVSLPAEVSQAEHAYLPVRLSGRVVGPPVPVFGTWREAGAGYHLVVPFATGDRRVLVDLGVAPDPYAEIPDTAIEVLGNLHWPDETEADPTREIWTSLDVPAMAERLGTEPVYVVARSIPAAPPTVRLVPIGTEGISNNHLGYAVQWFGLAAVWAGMTAFLLWRIHTRRDDREG